MQTVAAGLEPGAAYTFFVTPEAGPCALLGPVVPSARPAQVPPLAPSRTKWTRLVHPSVLIGHVSSLSPALTRSSPRQELAPKLGISHFRGIVEKLKGDPALTMQTQMAIAVALLTAKVRPIVQRHSCRRALLQLQSSSAAAELYLRIHTASKRARAS